MPKSSETLPKDVQAPDSNTAWGKCVDCPLRAYRFCAAFTRNMGGEPPRLHRGEKDARPQQNLYRAREALPHFLLVREGIAFRYVLMPGGQRQILTFCLPGDFLVPSATIRESVHFSVQALTMMRLCVFDTKKFRQFLDEDRDAMRIIADICIGEKEASEARIVDLGRRSSEGRVARFLLDLMSAMQRGEAAPQSSCSFPIRQQHIADALGLTQVHVSRVIGRFRQQALISMSRGKLEIVDTAGLRNVAGG